MYSSFVGIDIGKWNHQAAFLELSGKETARSLAFQNTSEGFQSLLESLATFDKGQTVIGLEATGHYWLASRTDRRGGVLHGLHGYRVQPEAVDQLPGAFGVPLPGVGFLLHRKYRVRSGWG